MDLDVLYKCPKDLCWQNIKQFIESQSIDLAIYKPCLDIYITKKTIWNTLSRLKSNGIFCFECEPENVSEVINIIAEKGYKYIPSCFISHSRLVIYIFAYKNPLFKPKVAKLYRIDTWEEDVPSILTSLISFGEIVLLLGDALLPFISNIKNRCRYVISFGGDDIYCEMARNEGIRIVNL